MSLVPLERYDSYVKNDIDWLCQDIPTGWTVKRIKDLAFLQSGQSIVSEQIETEGEFPVYGGNGLRGFYSEYTNNGSYALIGRQGALCGNINYAYGKFWASEHAVVAYLQRNVQLKWFGELLRVMNLNQYSLAAAQPGLAMDRIKRLLIPFPPLPEQKAIANYLDTKTAQIDRKIELLSQKAEKYGKLKQSLINETVTRGLDQSAPMKESGIEWIGDVPAHWEVTRNKDIFKERGSLSVSGDETLLTVSHITGVTRRTEKNVNMFMAETMEGYKHCKSGDLLINTMWAWMGALGTAKEDGICSPAYGVYKPKKKQPYNHRYFDYLYRTPNAITEMTRNSKGIVSSRLRLYPKDFFQILTALPPEEEQAAIADYLNERTVKIDQIIETINRQIKNLKELRKTLINDVVTGKIKVVDHG